MAELNEAYKAHLDTIAEAIQASAELAAFLDTEEPEEYKALQEMFEPALQQLYDAVAASEPLQLMSLESAMLDDNLVGLFLPRILGFAILRGQVGDRIKYIRPQAHFRQILLFICNSPNFDILKNRIGQSVQVGFSLSSDIWITNILSSIDNRRVKWWLQNQKLSNLRDAKARSASYLSYKRQFNAYNYLSTEFPNNVAEQKILFGMLRDFLIYRINNKLNNSTLYYPFSAMLMRDDLKHNEEHTYLLGMFLNFFELNEDYAKALSPILNTARKENPNFSQEYLAFLLDLHRRGAPLPDMEADRRIMALLDDEIEDDIINLYNALNIVHSKGYVNEEVMHAVKVYHEQHEGLSDNNEAIRQSILVYVRRLMENIEVDDYSTWFDMHKIFESYMRIFRNEQFNQSIKKLYLQYLRKLLKRYTDKRGGDYQGIKKFTISIFKEMNFMKEKDVKDLFKTKRKRRPKPTRPTS